MLWWNRPFADNSPFLADISPFQSLYGPSLVPTRLVRSFPVPSPGDEIVLYTDASLAAKLGVSRHTVRGWRGKGCYGVRLRAVHAGQRVLIPAKAVRAFLAKVKEAKCQRPDIPEVVRSKRDRGHEEAMAYLRSRRLVV